MEIKKFAQCGSLESCDLLVQIKPDPEGVRIQIESNVGREFGEQIRKLVKQLVDESGVKNAYIHIQDQGALEFAIRARLETAFKRASGEEVLA